MLEGKSVLITGGTGSFGREATKTLLENYPGITRLAIYSRDEMKQFEMQQDPVFQELSVETKLYVFIFYEFPNGLLSHYIPDASYAPGRQTGS